MSQYLQWIVLTSITGSPLFSALVIFCGWWAVDRFTLGILPDPVRWVMRYLRSRKLRQQLLNNPHDRRARHELGEYLVSRRKYQEAVDLIRPNVEAGDDDVATVFVLGVACLGAGHHQQGEALLAHAQELDEDFRVGQIDLELGRWRLTRGKLVEAREALERFIKIRRGTIEGRTLLATALARLGDEAGAHTMRQAAWNEYVTAPGFQRRTERLWAWRAKPSRPATYALLLVLGLALLVTVGLPRLNEVVQRLPSDAPAYLMDDYDEPGLE